MSSGEVPENANEGCVGPASSEAGKAAACEGCPNQANCASGDAAKQGAAAAAAVGDRLSQVRHKILVLSGKGGVGKSTVAAQLAFSLAAEGKSVGLLDVDICGPSIPRMLGLMGREVHQSASGWSPVYVGDNLGVMSIGFMLPSADDAIVWRGPRKNGIIKQFLTDVDWGTLDYLIVDTPPGTSDEHISMVQYLKAAGVDGALVVTTPQEVSMADVRKELNFCAKTALPVLGVVENMAEMRAPLSELRMLTPAGEDVTEATLAAVRERMPELLDVLVGAQVFPPADGGPEAMAERFGVPYLGRLPLDPNLLRACEQGVAFSTTHPTSAAAAPLRSIVEAVVRATTTQGTA
eukprot:CAMPEP_0198420812 /NCGR_PEP_ID=MMETSP1452-20131203/1186_1 /TAXON_ID=1181717 /ORGANISM="Synchroma pusillum, Strain CCMP3072" /LENGTH=349 /DNA_ID=CAMNT_0044140989 /DNA_START=20 /DNA_END=1069 /DNA_ORIENTATION=+